MSHLVESFRWVLISEVVSRDIDFEFSAFLGDYERLIAVRVLEVLGEINQKWLAVEVDASESSLS